MPYTNVAESKNVHWRKKPHRPQIFLFQLSFQKFLLGLIFESGHFVLAVLIYDETAVKRTVTHRTRLLQILRKHRPVWF